MANFPKNAYLPIIITQANYVISGTLIAYLLG